MALRANNISISSEQEFFVVYIFILTTLNQSKSNKPTSGLEQNRHQILQKFST